MNGLSRPSWRIRPLALLFALCSAFVSASAFATNDRPNILFLFSDDHACRAISAYDKSLIRTPNIDRIANEGVRFDRCYVTNSICGPSRACILTGQYSHKNGYYKNDQEFNSDLVTFPKLLQSSGYQTSLIGKWHLGRKSMPVGFDHWMILDHQGYYYQPKTIDPSGKKQRFGYVTDVITDDALNWLEHSRVDNKPFLLMVQFKAPHRPWDPGPNYLNEFADKEFPEPTTLFDDFATRSAAARDAQMRIKDDLSIDGPDLKAWDHDRPNGARDWFYNKLSVEQQRNWLAAYERKNQKAYQATLTGKSLVKWKYQRLLQDYLACVSGMDAGIGRILDYLEAAELSENTIVVYSSDQGFFLGEHGWFDKRFMYEPSLRTPLVIRWPKVSKAKSVVEQIVSNVDFAPTFLDVAGIDPPDEMQGASLVPFLRAKVPQAWRRSFYYHYYEGVAGGHGVAAHEGVTTGTEKLIHFYTSDEWELYDLNSDPHEVQNRFGDPAFSDLRARLLQALIDQKKALEVPDLTSNQH